MMKLIKEIEKRKKNEENISQLLKDKSDECCRLDYENDQLKHDLHETKEELGKEILLKFDLEAANEYKEKF